MKTYLSILCALFLLCAKSAYAADLVLTHSPGSEGASVAITASLDTKGESINALEGTLVYPKELKLREIRDGNSIINFWLERPHDENGIRFAGITPGGYRGPAREVFTLVFDVLKSGGEKFLLRDGKAYLSDGEGTLVALTLATGTSTLNTPAVADDRTPPEPFEISRGKDPTLFNSESFIAFASQDKQTGIDHYELAEFVGPRLPALLANNLSWKEIESPYEIASDGYVYVKAVDRAGNSRLAVLSPSHLPLYYNWYILLVILMTLLVCAYVYYVRRS